MKKITNTYQPEAVCKTIVRLQDELDNILPHISHDAPLRSVMILMQADKTSLNPTVKNPDAVWTSITYSDGDDIAPSFIIWLVRRANYLAEQIRQLEYELSEENKK